MLPAVALHLLQWILAFLALDLLFRTMDVRPGALAARLPRHRRRYGLLAAAACAAAGLAQARLAGAWGLALAAAGWLPWWLLWRFGWRKQFPYLRDTGPDR